MRKRGFTLVELVIAMAILLIIGALGMMAFQAASTSMAVAAAKDQALANVRDVLLDMTAEIEMASSRTDNTLVPPLQALRVVPNPAPGSLTEVIFQVPLDGTGLNWSNPVRYRFINEDQNANARLDAGEDVDGDGLLTRRVVRIEDRNGDGDTADPGEVRTVGSANDLSTVQFAFNNNELTITLAATASLEHRRTARATAAVTSRVYLQN